MGLRGKLLLAMIIYFAGFASAIYYQAPSYDKSEVSQKQVSTSVPSNSEKARTKGEILAEKVHENLLEFRSFAEEKVSQVGASIKQSMDEQ